MNKYTIKSIKSVEKKEKLLNYSSRVVSGLSAIDFETVYPEDYISKNGNTIADYRRVIDRLSACSSTMSVDVESGWEPETGEVIDKYSVVEPHRCNLYTLCPVCASAKRSRIFQELNPYIKTLKKMPVRWYLATITIKTSDSPELAYDRLRSSWTKFVKKGEKRHCGRSAGEAKKFLGSLLSVEVVKNDVSGLYHVHGHVLIVSDSAIDYQVYDQDKIRELRKLYGNNIPENELLKIVNDYVVDESGAIIPLSKLSREWYDSSGCYNFHCAPIYSNDRDIQAGIEYHLYEVVKYVTKPWELEPLELIRLYDALQGKRRITKAGVFLKKNKRDWYRLIVRYSLQKTWKEFSIVKSDDFYDDNNLMYIDRTVVSLHYDGASYVENGTQSYSDYVIYKYCKKGYDIERCKLLNEYRSLLSAMKKTIGTIDNRDWIEKKELLIDHFRKKGKILKLRFLTDLKRLSVA